MLVLALAAAACSPSAQLQVTYGDWESLPLAAPPADSSERPSVGQVWHVGQGPAVALGDLVELHLVTTSHGRMGRAAGEYDEGRGWLWIGFDTKPPSDFPVGQNPLAEALIGLRQGSLLSFSGNPRSHMPGLVRGTRRLPFGDADRYYAYRPDARSQPGHPVHLGPGPEADLTRVEIVRVCSGRAEQRLIELLDKSPITVSQDLGRSYETTQPRWKFVREARWEGSCPDGKHASFLFGPVVVLPPLGKSRGLDVSQLWEPWLKETWKALPVGVVVR